VQARGRESRSLGSSLRATRLKTGDAGERKQKARSCVRVILCHAKFQPRRCAPSSGAGVFVYSRLGIQCGSQDVGHASEDRCALYAACGRRAVPRTSTQHVTRYPVDFKVQHDCHAGILGNYDEQTGAHCTRSRSDGSCRRHGLRTGARMRVPYLSR
jgi:hypothetical protein